ncbi:MAG: amidohydrolase family protein [Oscillospiraceae bacterium]|nr:amidohydrolase family protein [Oscillospiraceae bacterium]
MLVIKNAKIFTSADKVYEKGDIVIENDKIKAIGENLEIPCGAEVIDAEGLIVTPGLVDAHSHIGTFSFHGEQDANELTNNATPQVEVFYGIDTESKMFPRVAKAGITTSCIAPGSGNVIGGMVCAVKSHGDCIEDMCIANPVALKMAMGVNPKGVYGKRNQLPMTRMGIPAVIRENFIKAQEYMAKKEKGEEVPFDQGLENICKVLRREIPVKVHCEQFEMLTVIRLCDEFNIEFTLDHAWGSSDFYDEIANAKNLRGIIFGPVGAYLTPGECGKIDPECLPELDRRGVCCSIMTDGPVLNPDIIIAQAGEAVRFGLDPVKAIEMLTINPAKIIGIQDRVGSLEVGKDADIVIFKGQPAVDTDARVLYTIINGKIAYKE